MRTARHVASRVAGLLILLAATSTARAQRYAGRPFPEFTATDAITGDRFSLEDLRGKVVLVDFWATWCGPCVKELPNVKRAYRKYNKDGFEIISISLDKDERKFKRFVSAQKMSWHHVMEGGGWKSPLVRKFGVRGIPKMFLIDHEGVCISENARGRGLDSAIKAALGKMPGSGGADRNRDRDRTAKRDSDPPGSRSSSRSSPSEMVALGRRLEETRTQVLAAAEPVRRLSGRIDEVQKRLRSIETQVIGSSDARALQQSFTRVVEDLQSIRHEMFLCGLLNDRTVAVPADPSAGGETSSREAATAIRHELKPAQQAIADMNAAVDELTRQVASMEQELRRFERDVERGRVKPEPVSVKCDEAADLVVTLNTQFQEPWKNHLRALDGLLLTRIQPDSPVTEKLDSIDGLIGKCRDLLATAGRNTTALIELRQGMTTICSDTRSIAEAAHRQGLIDAVPDDLPTNPLEGRSRPSMQTRLETSTQLDHATEAVEELRRTLGQSSTDVTAYVEQIRELQAELEAAAGDDARERRVQQRFETLCKEILDRLG